jgi:hypothetical protein
MTDSCKGSFTALETHGPRIFGDLGRERWGCWHVSVIHPTSRYVTSRYPASVHEAAAALILFAIFTACMIDWSLPLARCMHGCCRQDVSPRLWRKSSPAHIAHVVYFKRVGPYRLFRGELERRRFKPHLAHGEVNPPQSRSIQIGSRITKRVVNVEKKHP